MFDVKIEFYIKRCFPLLCLYFSMPQILLSADCITSSLTRYFSFFIWIICNVLITVHYIIQRHSLQMLLSH